MKRYLQLLYLFFCCFGTLCECYAQTAVQHTENTAIELYYDGKNTAIAKFIINPGWHIYWSNGGDIGLPTTVSSFDTAVSVENLSVPQIRTVYEIMKEYYYENTAYMEIKVDDINNANLVFDFAECSDVCKPEKLSFDTSQISTTEKKTWQQIKKQAENTFPQKITLPIYANSNEIRFNTPESNIQFIPAERDIIDEYSVSFVRDNDEIAIKWTPVSATQLRRALIITPEKNYLADIVYEQDLSSLIYIILLAFIGGIILNAMPCVFPVLSLKIFTLIHRENHTKPLLNAALYTCGVLLSFLILTTILLFLKSRGEAIGWGFQLQSPWFVGIMAIVFFILFLYIMEWLRFPNIVGNFVHKAAAFNNFTSGFFAVLIASPCTGPFMGAAVGYAFMRSDYEVLAVFTTLAFGYALPIALIELFPQAVNRIMPKPGKWMKNVKIILAIPILLTSVWLSTVWYEQIYSETQNLNNTEIGELNFQPFNPQEIAQISSDGGNVFVEFTADWCLTCKFNEKFLINTERFKDFVKKNNIHLFIADLTEHNELYSQALAEYGRDSIPLYIYYSNGSYKILPLFFSISDMDK